MKNQSEFSVLESPWKESWKGIYSKIDLQSRSMVAFSCSVDNTAKNVQRGNVQNCIALEYWLLWAMAVTPLPSVSLNVVVLPCSSALEVHCCLPQRLPGIISSAFPLLPSCIFKTRYHCCPGWPGTPCVAPGWPPSCSHPPGSPIDCFSSWKLLWTTCEHGVFLHASLDTTAATKCLALCLPFYTFNS